MCGIAGFFATAPRSSAVAARMLAELRRRGPDAQHAQLWDSGFRALDGATGQVHNTLLHARLSIIDPRPEADQPMANARQDIWICYNGEVYGWQEDANELRRQGAEFRTHSDTEFILHAYERWGIAALKRLRGMFALAILDLRTNCLWLARDRLGLKPVLYSHENGEFAFASLVRALLPFLPSSQREFSAPAIDAYLAHRYVPAPLTSFQCIRRLPPAHWLRFDLHSREVRVQCYWEPVSCEETEVQQADRWQSLLDEAIELRTVADRPLGVFLSGGVDSTVIASRLAATGHNVLGTFTAAFPDSSYDESAQAAATAARLGLPFHAVKVPFAVGNEFARIVADLDEPFADPSAFPLWFLARDTSRQVKVVLSGDGGDELFGGYKRYRQHLRSAWRRGLRLPLPILPDMRPKGWRKTFSEAALDWDAAYSLRFSGLTPNQRRFLQPDFNGSACYWREPQTKGPPLPHLLELDRLNALPEYILRKADLCTMAHGLELRAPLLDHRLVEALYALPPQQRFTHPAKALLAQVCPDLLELGILNAKKRGFNPPLNGWLSGDLAERLDGLGARLAQASRGQINAAATTRMMTGWQQGAGASAEQVLQLLILDESLQQLARLAAEGTEAAP